MKKTSFALALAALFVSAAPTTASAQLLTLDGQAPLVLAHRGTTGYLPEHTLGGYELAVRFGVDYIEPDLQLTSDGHLVAMHDISMSRTTNVAELFAPRNGGYAVSSFTLAEVKSLTVKPTGTAANTYPGFTPSMADPFKIPTFQEVIDLARAQSALTGREIGIYPEAKVTGAEIEDKILSTLIGNGYGGDNKVFIQSFNVSTIQSLAAKQAALGQDFKLIVLSSSSNALLTMGLENINDYAFGVGISITGAGAGQSFIQQAHAAGLAVHGYTFNRPGTASNAISQYLDFYGWGIDGVFSNYSDVAIEARDIYLASVVPEPASWALMGAGVLGMAALRRRRAAAAAA